MKKDTDYTQDIAIQELLLEITLLSEYIIKKEEEVKK